MKHGARRAMRSEEIKTCPPRDARARASTREGEGIGDRSWSCCIEVAAAKRRHRVRRRSLFGQVYKGSEGGRKKKEGRGGSGGVAAVDERKEEGRIPRRNLTHG